MFPCQEPVADAKRVAAAASKDKASDGKKQQIVAVIYRAVLPSFRRLEFYRLDKGPE